MTANTPSSDRLSWTTNLVLAESHIVPGHPFMMCEIFCGLPSVVLLCYRPKKKIYDNSEIILVDSLLSGYSLNNLSKHFHSLGDLLSA